MKPAVAGDSTGSRRRPTFICAIALLRSAPTSPDRWRPVIGRPERLGRHRAASVAGRSRTTRCDASRPSYASSDEAGGSGRQESLEVPDRGGHRRAALARQIPSLRVAADQQGEPHGWQLLGEPPVPERRALGSRRQIPACASSRVAEPHRHLGNPLGIVEALVIDSRPLAQPIAACVIPGHPALVDPGAWRLADHEEPRDGRCLHDRPWTVRQMIPTVATGADVVEQRTKPITAGVVRCRWKVSTRRVAGERRMASSAQWHRHGAERAPRRAGQLEREAHEGELVDPLGADFLEVQDLDDRTAGGREHVGVDGEELLRIRVRHDLEARDCPSRSSSRPSPRTATSRPRGRCPAGR